MASNVDTSSGLMRPRQGIMKRLRETAPSEMIRRLSFRDVLWPAIAGGSAGPESMAPAVVIDCGLARAALRASHAPRNDVATDQNDSNFEIVKPVTGPAR